MRSERLDITGGAEGLELCHEGREPPAPDGVPQPRHQLLIIMQIMPGQQHRGDDLAGAEDMMQIGAAIAPAARTGAILVQRARIVAMAGIPDIDGPPPREGLPRAAASRRQHAVEHVDAATDSADNIVRLADPHKIARPLLRQLARRIVEHPEHGLLPLANGKSADRIAVETDSGQRLGALGPEVVKKAPLLDAEQRMAGALGERLTRSL